MGPTNKQEHVGIEIECFSFFTREQVKEKVASLGLSKWVEVGNDGSIECTEVWDSPKNKKIYSDMGKAINQLYYVQDRTPWGSPAHDAARTKVMLARDEQDAFRNLHVKEPIGVEFRVCFETKSKATVSKKLAQLFKWMSPKVNKSCGLHVHLDMRRFDPYEAVENLINKRNDLRSMVNKGRLRSEYCRAVTKEEAKEFLTDSRRADRYRDFNIAAYSKFRTIEVRLKEGSVDLTDIFNWVDYLQRVAYNRTITKKLKAYKSTRVAKLNRETRRGNSTASVAA